MMIVSKNLSKFTKSEVQQTFKNIKKYNKILGIKILRSPRILDFGRILVITPKKIGNAAKRNLIRRRLKSIFYENNLYNLSYDWIVIIEKPAISLSFKQVENIILSLVDEKK